MNFWNFLGVRARSLLEQESKSNSKRSNPTPIGPLVQDMIPTYQEKYDYVIFNRVPKVTFPEWLPVNHFRPWNFRCNLHCIISVQVCPWQNCRTNYPVTITSMWNRLMKTAKNQKRLNPKFKIFINIWFQDQVLICISDISTIFHWRKLYNSPDIWKLPKTPPKLHSKFI